MQDLVSGQIFSSTTVKAKCCVWPILWIEEEVLISSRRPIGLNEACICKSAPWSMAGPFSLGLRLTLLRSVLVHAIVLEWVYQVQAGECDAASGFDVLVSQCSHRSYQERA